MLVLVLSVRGFVSHTSESGLEKSMRQGPS